MGEKSGRHINGAGNIPWRMETAGIISRLVVSMQRQTVGMPLKINVECGFLCLYTLCFTPLWAHSDVQAGLYIFTIPTGK